MNQEKYIGYVALEIANTMRPSGLYRESVRTKPVGLIGRGFEGLGPLTTRHSHKASGRLKALEKGNEFISGFVAVQLVIA